MQWEASLGFEKGTTRAVKGILFDGISSAWQEMESVPSRKRCDFEKDSKRFTAAAP